MGKAANRAFFASDPSGRTSDAPGSWPHFFFFEEDFPEEELESELVLESDFESDFDSELESLLA
ncbi:MAG: hypothetical protein WA879_02370, partial [Candidatus Acidiferrales bacterium]